MFAIDGRWGTGKTTFVRMFSQHLTNKEFRVVNINAWETDYADSPLAALVSKVAEAEPEPSRRDKFQEGRRASAQGGLARRSEDRDVMSRVETTAS